MQTPRQGFDNRLFAPVDAASLTVFRIGFGLIMFVEALRYLGSDWIYRYYIAPGFYFKYYGFGWVEPWPGDGMYYHFMVLGLLGLAIAAGAFYRVSMVLFTVGFSYVFLLDQTTYLNHLYLVILFCVLLCVVPAHRHFALDAWRRPARAVNTVPYWSVWLLRAQMEIMLLYAGIVKVNSDWLQLEPLRMWLARRADYPLMGPWFTEDWVVACAAYGVILLHLVGAPLLLWKRTRLVVFIVYCAFHVSNHFVFTIGIFPWFTILGSLLFFDPDWPRQLAARLGWRRRPAPSTPPLPETWQRRWVLGFLGVWIAFQVLMPLRHLLYPGNVSWTEEGHRFAWMMKLRDKKGEATFVVKNPASNESWFINPARHLMPRQARKMATRPDMILQFAHYLGEQFAAVGIPGVEVYALVEVSLNGRPRALMIDPKRDLMTVRRDLAVADWILPLDLPLGGRDATALARSDDEAP